MHAAEIDWIREQTMVKGNAGILTYARPEAGWMLLPWASARGLLYVVELLMTVPGIDVNIGGCSWETSSRSVELASDLKTPLGWAVSENKVDIVKLLLKAPGIDVNKPDVIDTRYAPLHWAVVNAKDEIVTLLLNAPGINVNVYGGGLTPLHLAAMRGNGRIIALLLGKRGIDPNPRELGNHWTPLHQAASGGHVQAAELLANANKSNVNEVTSLRFLYRQTPMHLAVQPGHDGVVHVLLNALGISDNKRDSRGWTALHEAVASRRGSVIQLLVDDRAVKRHLLTRDNKSALQLAMENDDRDVVNLLLSVDGGVHLISWP
ncbi:Ankyrin repeat domain-containing protein [Plasmodiophora brassicae]|nr:hypothetical protein PBRA_009525 [Plasmodiophora brassicae]